MSGDFFDLVGSLFNLLKTLFSQESRNKYNEGN